jgi:hypothetical protein
LVGDEGRRVFGRTSIRSDLNSSEESSSRGETPTREWDDGSQMILRPGFVVDIKMGLVASDLTTLWHHEGLWASLVRNRQVDHPLAMDVGVVFNSRGFGHSKWNITPTPPGAISETWTRAKIFTFDCPKFITAICARRSTVSCLKLEIAEEVRLLLTNERNGIEREKSIRGKTHN